MFEIQSSPVTSNYANRASQGPCVCWPLELVYHYMSICFSSVATLFPMSFQVYQSRWVKGWNAQRFGSFQCCRDLQDSLHSYSCDPWVGVIGCRKVVKGLHRGYLWSSAREEVCAGLESPNAGPPLGLSFMGQGQVDAWMRQGGKGGVVVLLQALLEQTVRWELYLRVNKMIWSEKQMSLLHYYTPFVTVTLESC